MRIYLCLLFFSLLLVRASSQSQYNLYDSIPFDTSIKINQLPNGFTYYLKHNTNPKGKVFIGLVVGAGNNQVGKNNRHMAHLMEHMPFKGTKHFQDPWRYFMARGLAKGEDINATTGGNMTYYYLNLSPGKQLLKDGLLFLRDCIDGVNLNKEDLEAEKGALNSELSGGANSTRSGYARALYGDSAYEALLGAKKDIFNISYDSVVAFYKKWYLANRSAIIVVGDGDMNEIEKDIISVFSSLPKRETINITPPEQKMFKSQVLMFSDEAQAAPQVQIIMRTKYHPVVLVKDYASEIVPKLYSQMMRDRLNRLLRNSNSGVVSAISEFSSRPSGFLGDNTLSTVFTVSPDSFKQGFIRVVEELERVKRFGFSNEEINKAKQKIHIVINKDSKSINAEISQHFIDELRISEVSLREKLLNNMLDGMDSAVVDKIVSSWINYKDCDIVVYASSADSALLPSIVEIDQWKKDADKMKVAPVYATENTVLKFTDTIHSSATISSRKTYADINLTEVRLSNGVRLLLKPLSDTLQNKRIVIAGYRNGGLSDYANGQYASAVYAPQLALASGIAGYKYEELQQLLANINLSVYPYLSQSETCIAGQANIDDLDRLLFLINQYITKPQFDSVLLKKKIASELRELSRSGGSPDFVEEINKVLKFEPRRLSAEELNSITYRATADIYRENFSDLSKFTFIVTGAFNVEQVLPKLIKYLGFKSENIKPGKVRMAVQPHIGKTAGRHIFHQDLADNTSNIIIRIIKEYNFSVENNIVTGLIRSLLEDRLWKRLREDEGAVYYMSVSLTKRSLEKKDYYDVAVSFTCNAEKYGKLIDIVKSEVENLLATTNAESFERAREVLTSKIDSMNADAWVDYLHDYLYSDLNGLQQSNKMLKTITIDDFKRTAAKLLKNSIIEEFVNLPLNRSSY